MGLCNDCYWGPSVEEENWPGCIYFNEGDNKVADCRDFLKKPCPKEEEEDVLSRQF